MNIIQRIKSLLVRTDKEPEDFAITQTVSIRSLWNPLPLSYKLIFWRIVLQHHFAFYRIFGNGRHWQNIELFHDGLSLLETAALKGFQTEKFADFMRLFADQALPLDANDDYEMLAAFPGSQLYTVLDYFQAPSEKKCADCFFCDRLYDDLTTSANDAGIRLPIGDPQEKMDQLIVDFLKELESLSQLPVDWETRFAHYGEPLLDLQKIKEMLDSAADAETEVKK